MTETASRELTGGERTRARILDAAAELLGTVGITRTTTKEIARAAGCSEATLYKYFRDKEEIFVRVLRERAPGFPHALADLVASATADSPRAVLVDLARTAVRFYRQSFPMAASLFASPGLLATHRDKLDLDDAGPQMAARAVATYLRAEQGLGRIRAEVDPDAAALLFVGACFHRAFLDLFLADRAAEGDLRPEGDDGFAAGIVDALLVGLNPAGTSG